MEGGGGSGCEPRRDGRSDASGNGNLIWDLAGRRSFYATNRFPRVLISYEPLGFGVGNGVDLGAAGSGARVAGLGVGPRGKSMGCRRVASKAVALVSVVVIDPKSRASFGHYSHP